MGEISFPTWLHCRRLALQLTQAEVAKNAGTSYSAISAIESGARPVGPELRAKLEAALAERPSVLLNRNREAVLEIAKKYGISDVQVFGSIAKNTDTVNSDVDLLVTAPRGKGSVFAFLDFEEDLSRMLGVKVDVLARVEEPHRHLAGRVLRNAMQYAVSL